MQDFTRLRLPIREAVALLKAKFDRMAMRFHVWRASPTTSPLPMWDDDGAKDPMRASSKRLSARLRWPRPRRRQSRLLPRSPDHPTPPWPPNSCSVLVSPNSWLPCRLRPLVRLPPNLVRLRRPRLRRRPWPPPRVWLVRLRLRVLRPPLTRQRVSRSGATTPCKARRVSARRASSSTSGAGPLPFRVVGW